MGDLAKIFWWRSDLSIHPSLTDQEVHDVAHELSDVLLYLVRIADVCGVDLGKAALDKLATPTDAP